MTCRGRVRNGVVVLERPGELPDGTEVSVRPLKGKVSAPVPRRKLPTLAERLAPFIGAVEGLPPDFSVNHDHYLYGVPKRQ